MQNCPVAKSEESFTAVDQSCSSRLWFLALSCMRCVTKSAVKNYPLGYNKLSWAVTACEGFTTALLHYYSHVRIVLMSWQLPKKKKKITN